MRYKCPFPGCNHLCEVVTKVHCRTQHNMEREEIFNLYGKPEMIKMDPKKLSKNSKLNNEKGAIVSMFKNNVFK